MADSEQHASARPDAPRDAHYQVSAEPRWKFVQGVMLPIFEHDTEGICCPPSRVVEVSVVAERAFIRIADYSEDSTTTTLTTIESEAVSAEALLLALVHQMGVEFVQGLLRRVEA